LFASLVGKDDESATASLTFYDEYLAVTGLAAAKRRHPMLLGAGPRYTKCHKKTDAALLIWLRGGVSHGRKNT
jgi:hypothetical protein